MNGRAASIRFRLHGSSKDRLHNQTLKELALDNVLVRALPILHKTPICYVRFYINSQQFGAVGWPVILRGMVQ
jgi:hypothetical protein